jgi:hypothetical protein
MGYVHHADVQFDMLNVEVVLHRLRTFSQALQQHLRKRDDCRDE